VTIVQMMLCSCHESPRRAAARRLAELTTSEASDEPDLAEARIAAHAAQIVGEGTLVVIVRDSSGVSWQLLPAKR